jgi:hypothetical protein
VKQRGFYTEGDKMRNFEIKTGCVYHIKDSYFELAQDSKLMKNREGNANRPTYFCIKDEKTGLLWVIPMSWQVEKYNSLIKKDTEMFGKCLKVLVSRYGEKESAFLFQNMFPIQPQYIDHIHTVGGIPMAVNPAVQKQLTAQFKEVRRLHSRGVKIVFTDINRLEKLMLTKKYDLILLDLDGTLTDPQIGMRNSMQYALGVTTEITNFNAFIGPPLRDTFREAFNFHGEQNELAVQSIANILVQKGFWKMNYTVG